MNRTEALHILGLEDDATADDIKIAYRETVQILHPDKFAGNEKLQNRATEQFKRLQEAYDLLTSGSGGGRSARAGRSSRSGASSGPATSSGAARAWTEVEDGVEVEYLTEAEIKARLAGIAAARAQLVAQRDTVSDERRNGLAMAAIGAVATLLTIRRPFGILGMIAAVAGTATVWGIIQFLGAQRNLNTLNEHLAKLTEERKEYEALLEE
ncbi:J domain-containing protein [Adlercreutzia equolifaciens]|uniref:J domain-containing protein n=1 Tax=Adlercreutzia equolifaciens TaxID=446660 RepID=A0A6L8Q8Y3_9ACTN|nr:J domain-containing protein [Adlercreutzia equolifaciens]MCG4825961.1 J domain-containing protein [Adlercreutzia equolifaciens]MDR3994411.1 J domain-containing protein [Adlercreutzia sp.]MEE0581608.1 J domain-containing protein [Adlercreutzia sp.]MZG29044.1 J domain-containing protein [Adlercreutzia equolifaciens]